MDASQTSDTMPFGELFQQRKHIRADLRLVRQAIKQGWDIPPATWRIVAQRLERIMADDMDPSNARAHIAAMEVILAARKRQVETAIRIYQSQTASAGR